MVRRRGSDEPGRDDSSQFCTEDIRAMYFTSVASRAVKDETYQFNSPPMQGTTLLIVIEHECGLIFAK